jgi:hypothetical protein
VDRGRGIVITSGAETVERAVSAEDCSLSTVHCPLLFSPRAVNAEGAEGFGFPLIEKMLDDVIDTASAGAAAQAGAEFGEVAVIAGGDNFHVAIFGIADPAAQVEFAGFAMHEPAEADALNSALNEEVKNHERAKASFADGGVLCNRAASAADLPA